MKGVQKLKILEARQQVVSAYVKLSSREKIGVWVAALVVVYFAFDMIYAPLAASFDKQVFELQKVDQDLKTVTIQLARYRDLKQRFSVIEEQFKKAPPAEGVLSYIDSLLSSKAQLRSGQYSIQPNARRPLGEQFEQLPFTIKFDITDLAALVTFLKELIHGDKPLLVTRLDINKSRRLDKLSVLIDVSSITSNSGK